MLKVRLVAFALLCTMIGAAPGHADNHPYNLRQVDATTTGVTLKLLLEQCDATADDMRASFCLGYITAAFDQLSLEQRICPPRHVTTQQIFEVGRSYLFGHAMHAGLHPAWLLSQAFRDAYGCARR